MSYVNCKLCPRGCGADRTRGKLGYCGCPDTAVVSKTMLHRWEEPVLSPSGLSGAIFFGGCSLGCTYCQNRAISTAPTGEPMNSIGLRQKMDDLIAQGAENIDLVTPTQYLPTILPALEQPLPVPVIYNCGGYETVETVQRLKGKVDIFLPDFKYADGDLAKALSGAPDYPVVALDAIKAMYETVGDPRFSGKQMTRGVIVRHLILPGQVENSLKVLDILGETFKPGQILVSLMRQYTPMPGMESPLDRTVTDGEFESVLSWMYLNGLEGFVQEKSAADEAFIPAF